MWKCCLTLVLVAAACAESQESRDYSQPEPAYHQPQPQHHYGGYGYSKPEYNYGSGKLPGYFQDNVESWVDAGLTVTAVMVGLVFVVYVLVSLYNYGNSLINSGDDGRRALMEQGMHVLQTIERLQQLYDGAVKP